MHILSNKVVGELHDLKIQIIDVVDVYTPNNGEKLVI